MRINIDHITKYSFSEQIRSVIQILRVTPNSNSNQNVLNWGINIDCDAKLTPFTDAYGNLCHILAIDKSISELSIETIGAVDTIPNAGVIQDVIEPFPASVFLRHTPLATPDTQIFEYAKNHLVHPWNLGKRAPPNNAKIAVQQALHKEKTDGITR